MLPNLPTSRFQRVFGDPLAPNLLALTAIFLGCCAFFVWAAGRNFDLADEAYYVLASAQPYSFPSMTEASYVLHPFYRLAGGDIALFRLLGAGLLGICAALLASALLAQAREAVTTPAARWTILFAIVIGVAWQYDSWIPTPSYNRLNLCGLMLFFTGLLGAGAPRSAQTVRSAILLPAILAGAGICVIAWSKPPSAALAVPAGLAWMLIVRQPQPARALLVAAATAMLLFAASLLLVDGGDFQSLVARKSLGLETIRIVGQGHDVTGMVHSVVGPFMPSAFPKLAGALLTGLALFAPAIGWAIAMHAGTTRRRRIMAGLCAFAFAIAVGIFRGLDFASDTLTTAFHGWHVALLICALAVAGVAWRSGSDLRTLGLAAILAFAPIIYSLGTGSTILRHMSSASVFWAAAAMLAATAIPPQRRAHLISATSLLCALATAGLLAGVAISSNYHGAPLWRQTMPVNIGPAQSRLKLEPDAARYLTTLQQAARDNGFLPGMPLADLSGQGPGITLALHATPIGAPWLHYSAGDPMAFIRHVLGRIPPAQLCQAWIVTGNPAGAAQDALTAAGLDFPAGYRRLLASDYAQRGWSHTLWQPTHGCPGKS